jgi:hypothetical protein
LQPASCDLEQCRKEQGFFGETLATKIAFRVMIQEHLLTRWIQTILNGDMQFILWAAFALAAIFEVGGDAVIRMGIKNNNIVLMFVGATALGG